MAGEVVTGGNQRECAGDVGFHRASEPAQRAGHELRVVGRARRSGRELVVGRRGRAGQRELGGGSMEPTARCRRGRGR